MLLLADAIADAMPAISSVGSLGFAIWFAWYTTVYTIPNLQKEHREAMQEAIASHRESLKEIIAEMRDQRDGFDKWKMMGHGQ